MNARLSTMPSKTHEAIKDSECDKGKQEQRNVAVSREPAWKQGDLEQNS